MGIIEIIKQKRVYFDGGTGTVLQSMGLKAGQTPESWNISCPEKIVQLHNAYLDAGCNIIKTNTFGVNKDKYDNYEELIVKAIDCAKKAVEGRNEKYIAFDIGPSGRMLKPFGDMEFEEAVELFAANVRVAEKCGVDLILIETMNDSYETKAAVIAAKENSKLPVFVTNAYDESGKLMTGADPLSMITMLEGLRVDALGMNCSFGPDKMLEIIDIFAENASVPIIVNPNAGLPRVENGKTVFDISPERFAEYMVELANKGACILGGCCGTTPEYIKNTVEKTNNTEYKLRKSNGKTLVSSYTHTVEIGKSPVLIGERINPTGKKKLKEALRENDMNYILGEGLIQAEKGAHILDVNVGLPEINEAEMMKNVVVSLQAVTDLPLQLDSSDPDVLEKSMRIYNGKPLINSVTGKAESMEKLFPLVRKYGGSIIALTMDEGGIPESAEERVAIAERIIKKASEYGIEQKDIIVDPLCLTISSDNSAAKTTLKAVKLLNEKGIRTSLGVSNISFGLPNRENINTVFFANALENGLDCAIMNPSSERMMGVYYSYKALKGLDEGCFEYIKFASENDGAQSVSKPSESNITLEKAIINGLKDAAVSVAKELVESENALDIINNRIVPALNEIGNAFEEKRAYLPQLLMSADAASGAFEVVKTKIDTKDKGTSNGFILATVKGDIHDIGKNIVKVLLESYGFKVYDLGRDVDPYEICEAVEKYNCKLVGLSALMTTTVPSMEETIKLLRAKYDDVKVIVGGAVLTQEYADMIGADAYAKDAMDGVRYAERFYK
ncbi:MAG: homocysteine S-methyltransferase family protein [Clostridia bacterium]|nr:homocysteine S-methyltransferase family protein [Clostridia bacterium]